MLVFDCAFCVTDFCGGSADGTGVGLEGAGADFFRNFPPSLPILPLSEVKDSVACKTLRKLANAIYRDLFQRKTLKISFEKN